jgi:hypothetical protein
MTLCASATRTSGDSATDPSNENSPTERGSGIRSTEADTAHNVSIYSAVNPVNNVETDSPASARDTTTKSCVMRSETGESNEEESPIRSNIQG